MPNDSLQRFYAAEFFPHYPQDHDWMAQLAYAAGVPLLEHRGTPFVAVIAIIPGFMDEERKTSPAHYWRDVKARMLAKPNLAIELGQNLTQLKSPGKDGKWRLTDCGNAIAIARIVMFIRDDKPEAFRTVLMRQSDAFIRFTQQNLFEGRGAYENQFYGRELPEVPTRTSVWEDLGYKGRRS